jgi:hypothetical protein
VAQAREAGSRRQPDVTRPDDGDLRHYVDLPPGRPDEASSNRGLCGSLGRGAGPDRPGCLRRSNSSSEVHHASAPAAPGRQHGPTPARPQPDPGRPRPDPGPTTGAGAAGAVGLPCPPFCAVPGPPATHRSHRRGAGATIPVGSVVTNRDE